MFSPVSPHADGCAHVTQFQTPGCEEIEGSIPVSQTPAIEPDDGSPGIRANGTMVVEVLEKRWRSSSV